MKKETYNKKKNYIYIFLKDISFPKKIKQRDKNLYIRLNMKNLMGLSLEEPILFCRVADINGRYEKKLNRERMG